MIDLKNGSCFYCVVFFRKMSEPINIPSISLWEYNVSHFTAPESKLTPTELFMTPSQPGGCVSDCFPRLLWGINQVSHIMLGAGTPRNFSGTLQCRKKINASRNLSHIPDELPSFSALLVAPQSIDTLLCSASFHSFFHPAHTLKNQDQQEYSTVWYIMIWLHCSVPGAFSVFPSYCSATLGCVYSKFYRL